MSCAMTAMPRPPACIGRNSESLAPIRNTDFASETGVPRRQTSASAGQPPGAFGASFAVCPTSSVSSSIQANTMRDFGNAKPSATKRAVARSNSCISASSPLASWNGSRQRSPFGLTQVMLQCRSKSLPRPSAQAPTSSSVVHGPMASPSHGAAWSRPFG